MRPCAASPRAPATRASPTTATAASSRCTATSCSASSTTCSRTSSTTSSARRAAGSTPSSSADQLLRLIEGYQAIVAEHTGSPFPQDVQDQLWGAIGAVFGSWMTPRAVTYRRLHGIDERMGTAVSVQAMVFGNRGETSATGVAFTRDPSTGEKRYYGEFLVNAQGEDVVAGIRTPQPLTVAMKQATGATLPAMEEAMPDAYRRARSRCSTASRRTTATCRTSSSRSRTAGCGSCRPAPASARPTPRSRSRSTWRTKG